MQNLPPYHEKQLLLLTSKGDQQAFAQLFRAYANHIGNYVYSITSEHSLTQEIVQDVFLKVWQQRKQLATVEHFKNYLFIITRNYTLNAIAKLATELKKKKAYNEHLQIVVDTETPEEKTDYTVLLEQAVNRLPDQQRQVYILGKREGMAFKDIAAVMQISQATVKRYMYLATQSVTQYLREHAGKMLLIPVALFFL